MYAWRSLKQWKPNKWKLTVMNSFTERGDFIVDQESVFSMLKDASLGCLSILQSRFDELQSHTQHLRISHRHPHVYFRFFWISIVIKFESDENSLAYSLWDENVLKYCSEMTLDSRLVNEVGKGLQLGAQLKLPMKHTFHYRHMADFIVKAKTMRSLAAVEYYFRVVEPYINDNAQLMNFLISLRKKYRVWLHESTTTIATLSHEGTLCGVNSEGINFANCIHEVCSRHNVESAVIEWECIKWLKMLIETVDFTNNLAKIHLRQFLSSEPAILRLEECRKAIVKCICDGTLCNLSQMTFEQFGSLFSALGVYSASIVEEFLKNCVFPPNFRINDSAFIIFLNKIVSKCKGAKNHSFLISGAFKSATDLYITDGRYQDYLCDLFEVSHKVPGLFANEEEGKQDENTVVSLAHKEFLRSIIGADSIKNVISTQNTCVVSHVAMSEDSECKKQLFDVLCEYISKCDIHEDLPRILRSATATLCRDMCWVQSTTLKQKFCLKCIVACCSRIRPPSSNGLQWVQTYHDIIMELARTYNSYCHRNGLTDKNGHLTFAGEQQLQTDLLSSSVEDVTRYFEWAHEVQDILKELNDRLVHQEITVNAITNIKDDDDKNLECLSFMMCMHSSVNIKEMKQTCRLLLEDVNTILLKSIPGQPRNKIVILPEIIREYHVALPQNLQEMFSKYVIYPSSIVNEKSSLVESSCLVDDGQSQPESKPTIELSRSTTMLDLAVFADELNKFHESLQKFIDMLTFFKFHNSALFHECLNAQHFSRTEEPQSLQIRDATTPLQHKEFDVDLPCFVLCLENVQKLIWKFLNGQGNYIDIAQIDPEGHLEMTREVEILQQYSAVFGVTCNGLTDTCNMLNLHKLVCQVKSIIFVCHQFKLEECLKDSRLRELQKEVLQLENEAIRSKVTSTDVSRKVKHMKELLCIADDMNLQCLDLFSAVKAHCSDTLIQLMSNEKCRLCHKDIAKHLQHEASAIQEFSSVVELMNPFFDAGQKFESLMIQVFEKRDVKQELQSLKNVNGQLSVINEVFSSESPVLCREEKLSAIQVKEDNVHLHEKIAQYEFQLKKEAEEKAKMQERIDHLEKENKALLRKKKEHHQEIRNIQKHISELTLEKRALERDNQAHQAKIQVLSEVKESLQRDSCTLRQEKHTLQQELSLVHSENNQLRLSQQESVAFGLKPWKVSRESIKLGKVIGGGGWGVVLKGDLKVAVKQFYPTIISSQNLIRLRREMEMLARIRHPNLVQFIAVVFEDDDNTDIRENPPYIITELLDISLREAYEKDQVPEGNMWSIFQDTARALDYLHRRYEPIIHRDVSSANVLLKYLPTGMWMAKVSDLGSANLAKVAFTKNEGALIYCAPEAFTEQSDTHSETALTPKVDVYSYGIMLCEVVNHTLPTQDMFQILLKQVECKQPKLYTLVLQCINQEPNKRPSMANVLTTLATLA